MAYWNLHAEVTGAHEVQLKLNGKRAETLGRIREVVQAYALRVQRKVVLEKLTGQVLKRQTGTLARSIFTRIDASSTSVIGTVGTNLSYGRAWELGFTTKSYVHHNLFGKGITATMPARTYAARPFLKPSLQEMKSAITKALHKAVKEAVNVNQ
jgi:phage gpG-like protein